MESGWPTGARGLYAALDAKTPQPRAVLMVRVGLASDATWRRAIQFLVENGYASRCGTRRTAVYTRGRNSGRLSGDLARPHVVPEAAVAYHGVLDEILRELGGHQDVGEQVRAHQPAQDKELTATSSYRRPTSPDEDGLYRRLVALGVNDIIDHRCVGGALWVGYAPGWEATIDHVAKEFGIVFHYRRIGGRATSGRAAWWTKGREE